MVLIVNILSLVLTVLQIAIIARSLFSWFDPTGRTPIGSLLATVTDPVIAPIRRVLPNTGMIDISPLVALLIIYLLQTLLSRTFVG